MKTYTINKTKIGLGIDTRDGNVVLGEDGRGRNLVMVPIPAGVGEFSTDGKLLSMVIPGAQPDEILVLVPDMSGFRGSSGISDMCGGVIVAEGACAQGDAGRMGGGAEYLLRVANGGTFTVRRSGRRIEWSVGVYTNYNGKLVFRDPVKEAETEAASAALFGAAPVISPEIAAANIARESARSARDEAAQAAEEAIRRGVEIIHKETEALWAETQELQRDAAVVRENRRAQDERDAAKRELGNGREAWSALDRIKI